MLIVPTLEDVVAIDKSSDPSHALGVYLAATAYDYEANLLGTDSGSGRGFLTDIVRHRSPGQMINELPITVAAKEVRGYAQLGDEMALKIFEQQAKAIATMFTIAANFTDPDAYFVGGGVVEAEPHFRDWFLALVREHTLLREEQREVVEFLVVSDLDMAGARSSAMAALNAIRP